MDEVDKYGNPKIAAQLTYEELVRTSVQRYKFQPIEFLDKLGHQSIYFSDPANFNDPFDLRIKVVDDSVRGPFSDEDKLRDAFRILLESTPDLRNHWFYNESLIEALHQWVQGEYPSHHVISVMGDRLRRFGVACFAPDWNMPLMWAHYGKSHTGLCVEYLVRPMTLATSGSFYEIPVTYASELPSICFSEALFSPHTVLPRLLATKHVDWAYEKEWRLVHLDAKGSTAEMPAGLALGSLVIGRNASLPDRDRILSKGRELKVPVFQITQKYGTYDFERSVTWPEVD